MLPLINFIFNVYTLKIRAFICELDVVVRDGETIWSISEGFFEKIVVSRHLGKVETLNG